MINFHACDIERGEKTHHRFSGRNNEQSLGHGPSHDLECRRRRGLRKDRAKLDADHQADGSNFLNERGCKIAQCCGEIFTKNTRILEQLITLDHTTELESIYRYND